MLPRILGIGYITIVGWLLTIKFYIMNKESYAERLERECKEMVESKPEIKDLVELIQKISAISNQNFDYEIERTHLMYRSIIEII